MSRLAWFTPSFSPECGLTLPDSGLCTLHCVVPWPDALDRLHLGLRPDLLAPRWSREPVWLPQPELSALHEAFDRLGPTAPQRACIDGCRFRFERDGLSWEGNLGMQWPPALALALAVVAAARCASWRSTRAAFEGLALYLG